MNRFECCSASLIKEEEPLVRSHNTRLYDGDTKTSFKGGETGVTSYRIYWQNLANAITNCECLSLPLRYVVFIEEETHSTFSFKGSSKLVVHLTPPDEDESTQRPLQFSVNNYIKISFKNGLETGFIYTLKEVLRLKKWESGPSGAVPRLTLSVKSVKTRAGIIGIERGLEEKQKATESSISSAFKDLSKLMTMAKEMVELAKTISSKIREKQGNITEDETVQFKAYLLSLGIADPVTRGSSSSETQYLENLARQIVDIILEPATDQGGMMCLSDVYCRVNRARGLELVSPEDLLQACRLTERLGLPLVLRQFDSGVMVLQLASHSDQATLKETHGLLEEKGWLTAESLSQLLGVSVTLARERLVSAERAGTACRDHSVEGLKFYPNLFLTNPS